MLSNKENERRITVLEGMVEALQKMLVSQGTVLETHKNGLDGHDGQLEALRKMNVPIRQVAGESAYVSFDWNPALKLWRVQLENVDDFLKEVLGPGLSIVHDHPAQAFDMLLQKLQRKVS